jgi:hypothetical protein
MSAALLALALVALPPLSGWMLGGGLRRLAPGHRSRRVVATVLAALLLALPFALLDRLRVSLYDALLAALLLSAAAVARAWPATPPAPSRVGVTLAAASTLLALALLELVARYLPGAVPRDYRPLDAMHFYFPPEERDFRCHILFPETFGFANVNFHYGRDPRAGRPRTPGVRRVLYIGDSMVDGDDVPLAADFTELIAAARPAEEHWNLGELGIGPDGYLLVASKWARRLQPDEVVVFVFLGNDLSDMDQPYGCCRWGPLTEETAAGVVPRCARPDWREPLRRRLEVGPAPYPLRVLARRSELARRLAYRFEVVTARGPRPTVYTDRAGTPSQFRRFAHTMSALRDDLRSLGVALKVVLLPPRWTLEQHQPAGDPFVQLHQDVVRALRDSGIRTYDTWDLFQQALDRDGAASDLFQRHYGSPHLGVAGHRLLADWLLANVIEHEPEAPTGRAEAVRPQ